jgi:hypothetical protein
VKRGVWDACFRGAKNAPTFLNIYVEKLWLEEEGDILRCTDACLSKSGYAHGLPCAGGAHFVGCIPASPQPPDGRRQP